MSQFDALTSRKYDDKIRTHGTRGKGGSRAAAARDCGLHKLGLTVPPVHSHLKGGFLYFRGGTEPSGLLTLCIASVIIFSLGIAAMVSQATAQGDSIIIEDSNEYIDARLNCWGHPAGPGGAGTGKGDAEIKG